MGDTPQRPSWLRRRFGLLAKPKPKPPLAAEKELEDATEYAVRMAELRQIIERMKRGE